MDNLVNPYCSRQCLLTGHKPTEKKTHLVRPGQEAGKKYRVFTLLGINQFTTPHNSSLRTQNPQYMCDWKINLELQKKAQPDIFQL